MRLRTPSALLAAVLLTVAACGGSDDGNAEPGDETSGSEQSTNDDSSGAGDSGGNDAGASGDTTAAGETATEDDSAATGGTATGPSLRPLFSIATNGAALGADLAFSPDGTELAFMTGGLQAQVEVYDVASGALSRSGAWHGQGVEIFWTSDNRLVSYQPDRVSALDATTLAQIDSFDTTLGADAEQCSGSPFLVRYDPAANAMFTVDGVGVVCRVDLGTSTTTAAIITDAAIPTAFLRPDASELVVTYNVGDALGAPMAALLDPTSLSVTSTLAVPDGGVRAVTNDDLVVGVDRFTDQLMAAQTVLPAPAAIDDAGPFIAGSGEGELVLMDDSGSVVARGSEAFRPFAVTADGSVVAVLLSESLEIYATS